MEESIVRSLLNDMKDVVDEAKATKVMKMIRSIWDDNGAYTIITKDQSNPPYFDSLGIEGDDPISVSQWSEALEGKHLGKKIKFSDLPKNVQKEVIARLSE